MYKSLIRKGWGFKKCLHYFLTFLLIFPFNLITAVATVEAQVPILPGGIVINEIMPDPADVLDSKGEWFEIYNTNNFSVNINGWTIKDNDTNLHIINNGGPLNIPAHDYLVLGKNGDFVTNGGVNIDYVYHTFVLDNVMDEIILLDTQLNEIDRVEYSAGTGWYVWDIGNSKVLNDFSNDNNDASNWCDSTTIYGVTDAGTPGSLNDSCDKVGICHSDGHDNGGGPGSSTNPYQFLTIRESAWNNPGAGSHSEANGDFLLVGSGYIEVNGDCVLAPYCGDGIVNNVEECDDGNNITDDNCSNLCEINEQSLECILELTKIGIVESVIPGSEITYNLTLRNIGTAECAGEGVKVKDIFNENTSFVSSNIPLEISGAGYLQWNLGNIIPGESKEVAVTMQVSEQALCDSTLVNQAQFWSNQTGWGDIVTEETTVICPASCGDGAINNNEQCDNGTQNGVVCNPAYGSSCNYCSNSCADVVVHGSYCGDGTLDPLESCDDENTVTLDGCDASCKVESCELLMARIVIDESTSQGNSSYADKIYVGSSSNVYNSGEWFPLSENGVFINDLDVLNYENINGLAVQRMAGEVRVVLHGGNPTTNDIEHVRGHIEFLNANPTHLLNDTFGDNTLENDAVFGGYNDNDGVKGINAGEDEVWLTNTDNYSHFWLTVNVADDGYYTQYESVAIGQCEILCTDVDNDGYAIEGGECGPIDCVDNNALINPGVVDICGNQIDENCDGMDSICPLEGCDLIMARVNINPENVLDSNVANKIYVGSGSNIYTSGEWFPLYENGGYINDADINGYKAFDGIAIQRSEGNVRMVLGHLDSGDLRNVDGTIEFFNALSAHVRDDNSNPLEGDLASGGNNDSNEGHGLTSNAGNDEVWLNNTDDDAHFWLVVTSGDDGFYADYSLFPTDQCINNSCGNLVVEIGEACDDGAANGLYGFCKSDCSGPGPTCGDEIVNGNEECDSTANCNNDCSLKEKHSCESTSFVELINNGGFEAPVVSGGWQAFVNGTTGLDWSVDWRDGSTNPAYLELQKGVNGWLPFGGSQYAELDSHNGPASVRIYQDFATIPGDDYNLSFAFSARPGTDIENNKLKVLWNGVEVNLLTADGTGESNTNWATSTYSLTATATTTRLEFIDMGTSDTLGTFLDEVSVVGCGSLICTDHDQDGYKIEGGDCGPIDCDDTNQEKNTSCGGGGGETYGNIFGQSFNDLNSNGVIDSGESSLAGWGINLFDYSISTSTPILTATTTSTGYSFTNLDLGSYFVTQLSQTGWNQITPTTTSEIILTIGNPSFSLNFGNHESLVCTDSDEDTYSVEGGGCGPIDCNDNNGAIHPLKIETCNQIDDNCNGTIDEGNVCGPVCTDSDQDGHFVQGGECGPTDCDDSNPGKTTSCGGGGGGGGGGGVSSLYIHSEAAIITGESSADITWHTNRSATSKLVCDLTSLADGNLGSWPDLGYSIKVGEDLTKTTFHKISILNVAPNTNYYCRAISEDGSKVFSNEVTFKISAAPAFCGDGKVNGSESCDDSNNVSGDGCSATCAVENCVGADYVFETKLHVIGKGCQRPGWTIFQYQDSEAVNILATGLYKVYAEVHRSGPDESQPAENIIFSINGMIGNKMMDKPGDETINTQLAGDFIFYAGSNNVIMDTAAQCPTDTTPNSVEVKKVCLYKVETKTLCGDGNLEAEEFCDDGNRLNGDGCSNKCAIETTSTTTEDNSGGSASSTDEPFILPVGGQLIDDGIIGDGEQIAEGEVLGEKVISEEQKDKNDNYFASDEESDKKSFLADWWWLILLLILAGCYYWYEYYRSKGGEENIPKKDN